MNNFTKRITIGFLAALCAAGLAGCALQPPNVTSSNPATIDDTWKMQGAARAHLFFVREVNGKEVPNALIHTRNAGTGQGLKVTPRVITRRLDPGATQLEIVSVVYFNAPIAYLLNPESNWTVSGTLTIDLEPGAHYLIRGELSENYRAVWIEDGDGKMVSSVVESKGKQTAETKVGVQVTQEELAKRSPTETAPKTTTTVDDSPLGRVIAFLGVQRGESLAYVTSRFGKPDRALNKKGEVIVFAPGIDTVDEMTVIYKGLGSIIFRGDGELEASVVGLIPDAARYEFEYGDSLIDVIEKVTVYENAVAVVSALRRSTTINDLTLDKLANMLEEGFVTENRQQADVLSHVCYILASEPTGRFRPLLERVSRSAPTAKLKRHSKKALAQMQSGGRLPTKK